MREAFENELLERPMTILYAVADGSGATYRAGAAYLYDWFKDEPAAQKFARDPKNFEPLHEGTIFRLDFGAVDDDLLCSLMAHTYEGRVNISIIRLPPIKAT